LFPIDNLLLRKEKTVIRITSKKHNFRRCGVAHPKEPTEYPDDRFSEEELEILTAEPMLTVEVIPGQGVDAELLEAAAKAVEDGRVIGDGRPDVKALSEILGRTVTAADRDRAWEALNKE